MEKSEYSAADHWDAVGPLVDAAAHWRGEADMWHRMWQDRCSRMGALEDRIGSMEAELDAALKERDSYKAALDAVTGDAPIGGEG